MAWRDTARRVIQKVISEHPGMDKEKLKKLISKQYPFGERQYHPYKIWLDEIKIQLKERKFGQKKIVVDPKQQKLF